MAICSGQYMNAKEGMGWGWEELGDLGWHIYIIDTMYEIGD